MDKRVILIFYFMVFSCYAYSQKIIDSDNIFFPALGLSIQEHLFGEANLCYGTGGTSLGSCGDDHEWISKIGSEFSFNNKDLVLGPKLSLEYVRGFLGARINLIDYTDFKTQDWRFTPEIGITLGSFIDIYYGYNIPLTNDRLNFVAENRVTLTIILPYIFGD
jgi:hypothetical protein